MTSSSYLKRELLWGVRDWARRGSKSQSGLSIEGSFVVWIAEKIKSNLWGGVFSKNFPSILKTNFSQNVVQYLKSKNSLK